MTTGPGGFIRRALRWARRRRIEEAAYLLRLALAVALTRKLPRIVLYFGLAPGDDLLCTAVARELTERGTMPVWMISRFPGLFAGAGDVATVVPPGPCQGLVTKWRSVDYRPMDYARYDGDDRSDPPHRHIIGELCAAAGINGTVRLRPYLTLADREIATAAWATGCVAIQSSGMDGRLPMLNKQWYPERFQEVVEALQGECDFVQIGSHADPPLHGAQDMRGKTSIRETAAVLHQSRLYIGTVGFLMHLARAVECPSVILYGGREAPWQSGYICNVNLYSPLPCAPCWRWNTCAFDRECMRRIEADEVVSAVRESLRRPRNPLEVETIEIQR